MTMAVKQVMTKMDDFQGVEYQVVPSVDEMGYSPVEQALMVNEDGEDRPSAIDKTKYKTRICRNWQSGNECPYGDRCVFAHGDHDKRRASEGSVQPLDAMVLKRTESGSSAHLTTALSTPVDNSTWYTAESPVTYYQYTNTPTEFALENSSFVVPPEEAYFPSGQDTPPQQQLEHSHFRYEPYMSETVCRVPVTRSASFLGHSHTTESNGLSDGGASEASTEGSQ